MYHGIINVYKERGFTSHDVVAKMRGILRQKKIGHTGTLDPEAEGVLPVCLGRATKLCDLMTDKEKAYEAVLLLGKVTDTQDIWGAVVQEREVAAEVTEKLVRATIMGFVGLYEQVPPMYSALKVNGKKLYELARAGVTIEREARQVEIYSIDIKSIELPRVVMEVRCSKGTYIRTLCHDIGEKLGCGGCMEKLLRTKAGQFVLQDSIKLDELETLRDQAQLEAVIHPTETFFAKYPAVYAKAEADRYLLNGNPLRVTSVDISEMPAETVRMYLSDGRFAGVFMYREEEQLFKPWKMFLE